MYLTRSYAPYLLYWTLALLVVSLSHSRKRALSSLNVPHILMFVTRIAVFFRPLILPFCLCNSLSCNISNKCCLIRFSRQYLWNITVRLNSQSMVPWYRHVNTWIRSGFTCWLVALEFKIICSNTIHHFSFYGNFLMLHSLNIISRVCGSGQHLPSVVKRVYFFKAGHKLQCYLH